MPTRPNRIKRKKKTTEKNFPKEKKLWDLLAGNVITQNKENSTKVQSFIMYLRAHLLKLELEPLEYKEKDLIKEFFKIAEELKECILCEKKISNDLNEIDSEFAAIEEGKENDILPNMPVKIATN